LLRRALPLIPAQTDLHLVQGGDHSFDLPKRMGVNQTDVWRGIVEAVTAWIAIRRQ
jgi:hypothetical protein